MKLRQEILVQNDCFRAGRTINPKGVMVHSTGANNPRTDRYTRVWNSPDVEKCVHAFIGILPEGGVGTIQTLPWTMRGWHCAGKANDTHIAFEICEDGLTDSGYFQAVYREAVELTAMLCKEYGLDPLADGVVICHQEGYQRGVASKHGDVLHWFPKFGKTMDDFRADVARTMKGEDEVVSYEQWKAYMEQYRKELGVLPSPAWGASELAQAVAAGVTDGSRPMDLATRQEVVSMLVRAVQVYSQHT